GLDIAPDLVDELLLRRERALLPKPLPELDHQPPAVEIAREIEENSLSSPLLAAVVRVDANRDRRPVLARPAGVDAVCGDEQIARHGQIRGRIAERSAACISRADGALDLR